MNIQAAIFDMDGVLVDSELYWKKYESEIYPQMGVKFTEAFAKEIMGLKVPDIGAHVKQN